MADVTQITFRGLHIATMLFSEVIFGPVKSRRFGLSLGINLLPADNKLCNFECIYCECGWTENKHGKAMFADRKIVAAALRDRLTALSDQRIRPDAITFAGNGEPTMHPEFAGIVDDVANIRDELSPGTQVVVLSNGMLADREQVRRGLMKADRRILKLDAGDAQTFRLINGPQSETAYQKITNTLESYAGKAEVQTMFLRAKHEGHDIDNTSEVSVLMWIQELKRFKPLLVQLYSVDREAPLHSVKPVSKETLERIAEQVRREGIRAEVF